MATLGTGEDGRVRPVGFLGSSLMIQ